MALPSIIANNLFPVGALAPVGPQLGGSVTPAPPTPLTPVAASLAFVSVPQEQKNWCWAAVAVGVAKFYNAATTWNSQCQVASLELNLSCCPTGSNPACDTPWYLDSALRRVGHYNTWTAGTLPLNDVRTEIDANRPVGVRIGWPGGGGHFVVLCGYSRTVAGGEFVTVEDPIYGRSVLSLATFATAYRGSGSWTHSYLTQP